MDGRVGKRSNRLLVCGTPKGPPWEPPPRIQRNLAPGHKDFSCSQVNTNSCSQVKKDLGQVRGKKKQNMPSKGAWARASRCELDRQLRRSHRRPMGVAGRNPPDLTGWLSKFWCAYLYIDICIYIYICVYIYKDTNTKNTYLFWGAPKGAHLVFPGPELGHCVPASSRFRVLDIPWI